MVIASLLQRTLCALRYPAFDQDCLGPYPVGAIQTRIPNGGTACQILYPCCRDGSEFAPYFRPAAAKGMAEYSRANETILSFLSERPHPCHWKQPPVEERFPIVIFSHGLGGCMEMYTQLCQQIASHGYCVIALEHEDGSGAYAEEDGKPIYYHRPDDTPYSRQKVVRFRRPFLQQRVQEVQQLLNFLRNEKENMGSTVLAQVWAAADTSQPISLLGHSFGGATMVMVAQQEQSRGTTDIASLSLLDCWAFSLEDAVLNWSTSNTENKLPPTLSILSEAWLTNSETEELRQLLVNSVGGGGTKLSSYYMPRSVHGSVSDGGLWFPRIIGRRLGLCGPQEQRHETIRTIAQACVQHLRQKKKGAENAEDAFPGLLPFDIFNK